MKKYWYHISCFLLLSTGSCSLDIPLDDEMSGYEAIDDNKTARNLLANAYANFSPSLLELSLLSSEFVPNQFGKKDINKMELYNWKAENIYTLSRQWETYYKVISSCNVVLHSLRNVKMGDDYISIQAEAYALKAYSYYMLVNLFAPPYGKQPNADGIVLRNTPEFVLHSKRSSVRDSYTEIEKLLRSAKELLSTKGIKKSYHYLSSYAVDMLLARVYLETQNYTKAVEKCNALLPHKNLKKRGEQAKKDYTNLWHKLENNIEVIFRSDNKKNINLLDISEGNTIYQDLFPDHDEIDLLLPHPSLISTGSADIRNGTATFPSALYDKHGKFNVLGKFRKQDGKEFETSLPLLRTAELYFIKAESLCKMGDLNQAKTTLDEFMFNRYTDHKALGGFTQEKLLEKISFEKQKEFLGEGISYFDMKRNSKEVEIYDGRNLEVSRTIHIDDFRRVLPLPAAEVTKSAGKVKQNRGWKIININN